MPPPLLPPSSQQLPEGGPGTHAELRTEWHGHLPACRPTEPMTATAAHAPCSLAIFEMCAAQAVQQGLACRNALHCQHLLGPLPAGEGH